MNATSLMLLAPPALHRFFVLLIKAYARIVVVIFQPQEFWDPLSIPLFPTQIVTAQNVAKKIVVNSILI